MHSANNTTAATAVPMCHVMSARSRSSCGWSRWPAARSFDQRRWTSVRRRSRRRVEQLARTNRAVAGWERVVVRSRADGAEGAVGTRGRRAPRRVPPVRRHQRQRPPRLDAQEGRPRDVDRAADVDERDPGVGHDHAWPPERRPAHQREQRHPRGRERSVGPAVDEPDHEGRAGAEHGDGDRQHAAPARADLLRHAAILPGVGSAGCQTKGRPGDRQLRSGPTRQAGRAGRRRGA